ncbi:DUF4258 domain-containing protein [Flavobacterium sp. NRK1]|jgi:hypothetical protein|uniref:DUF4258 domain-containing protein n=1 Tax=Flavobacterium sp. NRK1 TaxID=2954929 RepID=UPI002092A839|nr:DUF4258 domain-containing protein [Flavobacterium sp. NRK1]MCO6149389.1 DUF4258 domain-containing protein [Flavobacterium sp. NRK1]
MKFKYRLAYYLFGLTLGFFLVAFIFNKRGQDFCYLPNCRVLKDFRTKGLTISKEAQSTINEKWVTMDDIKNSLENGDVDFSKSKKPNPGGGKIYVIESRTAKNEPIILEIVSHSDRAVLKAIKKH